MRQKTPKPPRQPARASRTPRKRQPAAQPVDRPSPPRDSGDALREINRLLETVFSSVHIMLAYLDPEFNFIRVNRAYALADGRTPDFFPGKNYFELHPNPENEAIFRQVVRTGQPYFAFAESFEYAEHPERGVTHWDWSLEPTTDDDGHLTGLVLTVINVTERIRTEKAHRTRIETLHAVNHALTQTLDLDSVLETLLAQLERLVPFDSANVMLLEPDGRLIVRAIRGYERWTDPQATRRITFDAVHNPVLTAALASGRGLMVPDSREQPGWERPPGAEHVMSWLGVPLVAGGRPIGLFSLDKVEPGFFGPAHLELAESLAAQAAVAIENARLHAEVQRHAAELEHRVRERTAQLEDANRELRDSEARYRSLFQNMQSGFAHHRLIQDGQGRPVDYEFLEINSAFERLTGLKREQVVGRRVTEVIPGIRASAFDWIGTYGKVALTGQATAFEEYSEALQRWYSVVAFSNKPGEFAVLFHDVTERVKAEAAVRRLNADLQQRAAELEAAIKELEGFSYTVSHDLRAPLRAMDGFSRILLDEHAQGLTPEGERYLRLVRQNSQQMGALIDDLLAFSRLSRQPLKRQTISPADLVADAWETLRHERQGRVVELTVADLPPCQGDPTLLRQVWLNLLSNALKFTRRREVAKIEIGWHVADSRWQMADGMERIANTESPSAFGHQPAAIGHEPSAIYFVRDNGVGFDMRYADKLFGVFQRLHRSEEYEGTGVGLAIVQRIVHRHGGRVWVEAEVDRGATFYFTL